MTSDWAPELPITRLVLTNFLALYQYLARLLQNGVRTK